MREVGVICLLLLLYDARQKVWESLQQLPDIPTNL